MFGFAFYIIIILWIIAAVGKSKSGTGGSVSAKKTSESSLPAEDFERKIKSAFAPASNYVSKAADKSDKAGDMRSKRAGIDRKSAEPSENDSFGFEKKAAAEKKTASFSDMEDRENDWLAKQLRDEARMKQNLGREMFDLKEEHIKEHNKING